MEMCQSKTKIERVKTDIAMVNPTPLIICFNIKPVVTDTWDAEINLGGRESCTFGFVNVKFSCQISV
jgi:hypothetical protein